MTGTDLAAEMAAAIRALSDAQADRLAATGINPADIAMGLIGAALIRVDGEYYAPDPEHGRPAYITPVRVQDPLSPESSVPDACVRCGDIVDLLAWHPAHPHRWALRIGAAEWLGCIDPQYMGPAPVAIRRSPLAWFRAGCAGLVPLSRAAPDIYRALTWCQGGVVAEDAAHAAELRAILHRPWPGPKVMIGTISKPRRLADAA